MDKFLFNIKNLSISNYIILLFFFGYTPILFFGYFIQDDFGIINFYNYSIEDSRNWMCGVNNNRPLSCIYFSLLTRLWPTYQIYFLFIFSIYIFFVYTTLNVFNFILYNELIKKIFVTFLLFPFFSYTIFYSPAMQGIGAISLLLWSISIFFLKKFILKSNYIYFFFSFLFTLFIFLTYESAVPLLGISLFFPLLFKKNKIFVLNFLMIFFTMAVIYYLQKVVFPEIFNIDLSRIKLSIFDLKKILFLILVNIILTANILFHSFEIFIKGLIFNLATFNILYFLHLFLLLYLVKNVFFKNGVFNLINKKIKKNNYFIIIFGLMVLSVLLLNALMHTVANTGLEFIRYNNRALVSLSFLLGFVFVILFNIISKKYVKNLVTITFIFFSIFVTNFLFFQHNLIKEKFIARNIIKNEIVTGEQSFDSSKTNIIFVVLDVPKIRALMSYGTYDAAKIYLEDGYISFEKKPIYYFMSENKFCNKNFYDEYIKRAYLYKNFAYNVIVIKQANFLNISSKQVEGILSSKYKCNTESKDFSKEVKREVYLDDRFNSFFLRFAKSIYLFIK